jgi:chaperonin cofactor prefoldin
VKSNQHSQEIGELKEKANFFSKNIDTIIKKNEKYSQDIANVYSSLKQCGDFLNQHGGSIVRVDKKNSELSQKIESLEKKLKNLTEDISAANSKNRELEKKIAELESKNKQSNDSYASNFRQPEKAPQNVQTDSVIAKFNNWAANPAGRIPSEFAFLAGDPRIRTQQQLAETTEETKWITNRTGGKKYLFPNPNSFNQMTNLRGLYDMDQLLLKEKGRNKIKIITPCEISASGWIEFAGELKILP